MINNLKYFLLAILVFTAFGITTPAQSNDSVLVSGKAQLKRSDIDKLIEFYEWAFETKFTASQRERFQQYTEGEFRDGPAESRRSIDDIITTMPKILAADAEIQRQTRAQFVLEFIGAARHKSDENSRMLVGIYDTAYYEREGAKRSERGSRESPEAAEDSGPGIGGLSALNGKWVWGRSGSITTTTSGAHLGGNGSRHTYRFSVGGAVEYTGIMNVMTGGCNMQIFRSVRGTATLDGGTLTIKWGPASFSRDDSCSPSKNYKKTSPAETEVFQVKFKIDYGQKQLCLNGKDEMCFSPEK